MVGQAEQLLMKCFKWKNQKKKKKKEKQKKKLRERERDRRKAQRRNYEFGSFLLSLRGPVCGGVKRDETQSHDTRSAWTGPEGNLASRAMTCAPHRERQIDSFVCSAVGSKMTKLSLLSDKSAFFFVFTSQPQMILPLWVFFYIIFTISELYPN